MQPTRFMFGEFELDVLRLELWRNGQLVRADTLTLRLLELFLRNPGKLLTKEHLLDRVWQGRVATENSLMVAMTRLRKALGQRPGGSNWVVTVHGHGYRFVGPAVGGEASSQPGSVAVESRRGRSLFVGRDNALQELGVALDSMLYGAGSLVVLSGEAGIGKTRLAEAFAERTAKADTSIAWGHCYEQLDVPALWPFVQLLREVIRRHPADSAGKPETPADPRLQLMESQLGRLLPELWGGQHATVVGEEAASSDKFLLFDTVSRWLSFITAARPWVFIIDDLHRAEPASLELLLHLLPALGRMRCLIVATVREPDLSTETDRTHLRRVRAHRNSHELVLSRLDAAQVAEFVTAWLGKDDAALSKRIYTVSEGNPFFMTQLSHSLRDHDHGPAQLQAPERLLDLLQERFCKPGTRNAGRFADRLGAGSALQHVRPARRHAARQAFTCS